MKTSHGVIQGYDGVAAVDAKHQVIVHAEAFGKAQEHDLLLPMVEGIEANFQALGEEHVLQRAKVTADSGFHTEANLKQLHEREIDAYIADNRMRKRDPRFLETEQYRARHKRERQQYSGTKQTQVRQVAFFHGKADQDKFSFTQRMKEKIDAALGRLVYDRRLGTVGR
jgi:hypothetical protein